MRLAAGLACSCVLALSACGDGGGSEDAGVDPPFAPDLYCPGSAGCAAEGDDVLYAGAAVVEITPTIGPMTDVQTVDVNSNGTWEPEQGDEFADNNGNGIFDAVWIAGYGNARAASGVANPLTARALALRVNQTTIVFVALDLVGFFWDDVERVRAMVTDVDADYVVIGSTHTHEGPDTMGIWGVGQDVTGVDLAYMELVRSRAAQAIRDAVAALEPANVQYATTMLREQEGGVTRYVSDNRDPQIIDDEMRIARFVRAGTDETIATLVNFGSHPEYSGDSNQLLSADIVHFLRDGIENGLVGPDGTTMVPGVGGVAMLFQSAIGSQIGPQRLHAVGWDGTVYPEDDLTPELAETVGTQLGYFALQALGPAAGATTDETAALAFKNHTFYLDVENRGFHVAILTPLFPTRESFNWDPDRPLVPFENEPDLRTELAVIDVGRWRIVTIPGELDPSLFLGGYDGSYTPMEVPIVDTTRPFPPDLAAAPAGPYLRDAAEGTGIDTVCLFGLTNDELGYFVPEYDFALHPGSPYLEEAEGEHYEETVAVGAAAWPRVEQKILALLEWQP